MSLSSMLEKAKALVASAKKQADMNLAMFGYDDADKVARAEGVVEGIQSAMAEVAAEPFDTEMRLRIVYLDSEKVSHVYSAMLVHKLPFKLAKGDNINIDYDAFQAALFVRSVSINLQLKKIDVAFDRLVRSSPADLRSHAEQMASLAATGWMVRKVDIEEADKSQWYLSESK